MIPTRILKRRVSLSNYLLNVFNVSVSVCIDCVTLMSEVIGDMTPSDLCVWFLNLMGCSHGNHFAYLSRSPACIKPRVHPLYHQIEWKPRGITILY